MFVNKREVKIFLTFFIIYSFFVYWSSWAEDSRFSLIRAIVDEKRFEIDSFYNQTGDRSFYKSHYFSDKEPGMSFLATPIYSVWKFVYYNFFPQSFIKSHVGTNDYNIENVLVVHYSNLGFFILIAMILLTIFTSPLFSALTILLIYRISKYFAENEKNRLLLTFTAGLGTLVLPNALMFRDYGISTFLSFFAFFILFKAKQEKIKDKRYFILSGLLAGIAISFSIITAIIGFACFLYLFYFNKKKLLYFLFGGFIGILPFLLYNNFSFGSLFTLPRFYLDPLIWTGMSGFKGINGPNLFIALRLLFYPERGLFFYYPILLLSFIGLYFMYKKFKIESILILFIFFISLITNSSWWAWWGGSSFGPKHLTPIIPFLIIPLSSIFMKMNKKKILKILIFLLITLSVFYNFAGLRHVPDELVDLEERTQVRLEYRDKINTFEVLINPLYEYYIPSLLKDGPRSKLFESLFNPPINICMPPACGSSDRLEIREIKLFPLPYIGTFILKIPFLCLVPLFLITFGIWHKDILNNKKIKRWLNKKGIITISFVFLIIFFLLFIRIE